MIARFVVVCNWSAAPTAEDDVGASTNKPHTFGHRQQTQFGLLDLQQHLLLQTLLLRDVPSFQVVNLLRHLLLLSLQRALQDGELHLQFPLLFTAE